MTRCQRRRINRQNAQKSTGPRSPEGKDASRRNALAHGLRAETLTLPNEDPAEIAARTEAWFDHYEPDGPAERALVEQAALASLRLHRCARFEQATLAKQVREAERDWDRRQEDAPGGAVAPNEAKPAAGQNINCDCVTVCDEPEVAVSERPSWAADRFEPARRGTCPRTTPMIVDEAEEKWSTETAN